MAFSISVLSKSFKAKVSFFLPSDAGKKEENGFMGEFKLLPADEVSRLQKKQTDGELDDKGFCQEILCGWSDVVDDQGKELPFNQSNIDAVLNQYCIQLAVIKAFFEATNGEPEKN